VEGWLELADDFSAGRLSLEAPGADVVATLTTEQGTRNIALAANLSGQSFGGLAGEVAADVSLSGAVAELRGLSVTIDEIPGLAEGGPLTLSASGRLAPEVEVTGTVVAPELDETADLRIAEDETTSNLTATLVWQDLDLSYVVAERHFALSGSASLGPALAPHLPAPLAGLDVRIADADLVWSPAGGFAGGIVASVDAPLLDEYGVPGPLRLIGEALPERVSVDDPLVAEGEQAPTPLTLSLEASAAPSALPGSAAARLTVVIPGALRSPADLPLDGNLSLSASLPAQDQRLQVEAQLAGSFAEPVVSGDVRAAGPIAAEGVIDFAGGRGTLSLTGPHLDVSAAGDAERWSASATLSRLPVGEWLPQVADPSLSLHASAASGGGVTVDDLVLESRASSLTGAATIRDGVRVSLQAQVDLADLELGGTRLTGLLRGPMVLTAPSLADLADANVTAQLDAAGVGLAAVDASVDGVLQVGGQVSDPSVNALLTGNGELSGTLRLNAMPSRGRLDLRSTLAAAGLSTDIRVSISPEATSASGQARYRDVVVLLSDGPSGIQLLGAGRIDGWEALIANDLSSLTASGPLASVTPAVSGALELAVGEPAVGEPADPWLEASVTDFAVAGQAFSDLTITAATPGAAVVVTGDGLSASLSPSDLSWDLALERLALPASLELSLAGSGKGAGGRVEGTLVSGAGAAEAERAAVAPDAAQDTGADILGLDIDFTASFGAAGSEPTTPGDEEANAPSNEQPSQATFAIAGSALGGDLTISGARASTGMWSGDVSLSGAAVAGVELAANGVLQGQGLIPQAVVATAAVSEGEAPVSVAGRVSLGGSGVSFDQTAALPMLTAPLRLQGQLAPTFDVTLSAAPRPGNAGSQAGEAAPRGAARVFVTGGGLRATGEVVLPLGPVTVVIDGEGPDASPQVEVRLAAAPSVAAQASLVARDLGELVALVNDGGLTFTGTDAAHGALTVTLEPSLSAQLEGFGVDLAGFSAALSGALTPGSADLSGSLRLPLDLPAGAQAAGRELPLRVTTANGTWSLTSSGELGELAASFDPGTNAFIVDADLALPTASQPAEAGLDQGLSSGAIVGRITYDPVNGPAGTLALADVSLSPSGIGELTLNADAAIADGRLGGSARLDTAGGRVTLSGNAGLDQLFPGLAAATPGAANSGSNVELRVRTLTLQEFPVIAGVAPHLSGALSGVVQLRNGFLLGQLVAPDLAVGDRPVPASLQISGPPADLDAALQLAGSLFTADLGSGRIAGSSRLERFPLDLLGEAFVGPTDVTAFLTGVVRFDLPSTDPTSGYVRLATEEIVLERAGVTTRGEVALTYENRSLSVQNAEFGGEGTWRAQGVLGPELLDFTLEANDADFSPLLGLVPAVSRFGVGAAGSFTFTAQGDFTAPEVSLVSDALDVTVAGTRFRIEDTDVRLSGDDLSASTTVRGLDPLQGAIEFSGGATVMLEPLALRAVDFGFSGDLDIPGLGKVEDVRGTIQQDPNNLPLLFMTGNLGAPLTVQGTLVPLDLRASGAGLKLSLPRLLIADATVAANLTLAGEVGGVVVGGGLVPRRRVDDHFRGPDLAADEAAAAGQAGGET
ncbi:MAG TPA: hypothetical protein VFD39_05380, partial [Trueperaceae bacterium]|nr:hypothetical protein [Trueperaceae bacterium]